MVPGLLHGTLYVTIYGIDKLHTGCGFNPFRQESTLGFLGGLFPRTELSQIAILLMDQAVGKVGRKCFEDLKRMVLCRPEIVGSRLYATIDLDKARVARTRMVNERSRPHWNESFRVYCSHQVSNIIFTIKDDHPIGATLIGRAYLPVQEIINGNAVDRYVKILDQDLNPVRGGSIIHVKLQFIDVKVDADWSRGINRPLFEGVPYTYFKQRQGCKVTLYQDAHVPDDFDPIIPLSGEKYYEPRRCWEDIFDAITNARHIIYIAGWSMYTQITLIRDPKRPKPGGDITIGELLKNKANEGVRVLMLVWDDRTSDEKLKRDGLMATHDQETADYFRNTNVHCVLCPRNPDGGRSVVQDVEVSTMFTHHQKTVVVDREIPGGGSQKRRIVSFLGGIDLCDGRYDTQEHPLFKTLDTVHRDDFHQPNFAGSSISKGGPREPWHDIHCQLEGPVAWDVLYNFEQRWKRQVSDMHLLPLQTLDNFILCPTPVFTQEDPETWNVQLFRSIDGAAASDFPEDPHKAALLGLVSGKDSTIDRSIQDAYINAIRRAKDFIYIENQYFLGSSFGWKPNGIKVEDIGALHLIPKELSLKIVSKIEAGERFTVYIVIPMWPEGIPDSGSVQAILDWQRRTMEMMYSDVYDALKAKGLKANVRDYLTFFCLGNRQKTSLETAREAPEPNADYSRAQSSRRFMIYVHAKMMIVDDEYIIIGSANINQRSMDGARDSEIAMGGFQPHHISTAAHPARGQIHGFRMALWYEHLGLLHEYFLHPESVRCVQLVNQLAEDLWAIYSADKVTDLPGHLLRYPIDVIPNDMGKGVAIKTLEGFEYFPDTKARILGNISDYLPPILTT